MTRSTFKIILSVTVFAALSFAGFLATQKILHYRRYLRGEEVPTAAVLAADPLTHAAAIPRPPTLLLCDIHDPAVAPETNALAMQKALGPLCRVRLLPGSEHDDPQLYLPDPIVAFLTKNTNPGTPVFFLHGWRGNSHSWEKHATLLSAVGQKHPCITADMGGDGFGNDASVRVLEKAAAPYPKIVVVGESMGAALMWRYSEKHPAQIAAMVGIAPVCNLPSLCHHSRLALPIIEAYR